MTRSLIRLGNTIRARLDSNCMTNRHDERQWDDNDDAMTETDSDITRDYDSITRSYRRSYKRSYKRKKRSGTRSYKRYN